AVVEATGERFYEAELHRLRGELLLREEGAEGRPSPAEPTAAGRHDPDQSGLAEAEACFRRALTIARGQQAKSLELRAAMSLTRLYQKQDCQAEARPLLAEYYDWFTEGFDTLDLREAKALLEQVS